MKICGKGFCYHQMPSLNSDTYDCERNWSCCNKSINQICLKHKKTTYHLASVIIDWMENHIGNIMDARARNKPTWDNCANISPFLWLLSTDGYWCAIRKGSPKMGRRREKPNVSIVRRIACRTRMKSSNLKIIIITRNHSSSMVIYKFSTWERIIWFP